MAVELEGGSRVSYIVQLWALLKGTVVNVIIKFPTLCSAKFQLHGESHHGLYLLLPGIQDVYQLIGIRVLALQVEYV